MKKRIIGAAAFFIIAGLTMINVQASKKAGSVPLENLEIMAAEDNSRSGYPMGCTYNWEGYYCTDQGTGEHCRHGGEVGAFCNGGGSSVIIVRP